MNMFTDYDKIATLRETLKRNRPKKVTDADGFKHKVDYGEEYGKQYAEIGWCLPSGCCVVLEDHGNNPDLGVPLAVRFWL